MGTIPIEQNPPGSKPFIIAKRIRLQNRTKPIRSQTFWTNLNANWKTYLITTAIKQNPMKKKL